MQLNLCQKSYTLRYFHIELLLEYIAPFSANFNGSKCYVHTTNKQTNKKNSSPSGGLTKHHLCSNSLSSVMRLAESGSKIRRRSDKANVCNLVHGVAVSQELSLFHVTYSAQPVVGSSHGSSK